MKPFALPDPPRPRRRRLRNTLLGAGALAALALAVTYPMPKSFASRQARFAQSPNFADGHFQNPVPTDVMKRGQSSGAYWKFFFAGEDRQPEAPLPVVRPDPEALGAPPSGGVRVTWFGHSSVLVQIEGRSVLCDPMWSERSSPVGFAGPKRFHPPPLPLDELPLPDVVVISHDHYDHLDRATVTALAARGARFAVPLGVGARLEDFGIPEAQITELDWWESLEVVPGELTVTAAPARHFSGRGAFDRNRTEWASFALVGRTRRVFFGGDGGLFDGLAQIRERLGPFDLSMLEIGAYDDAWGDIHLGPVKALEAHALLGAGALMPIHWGTFNLGVHAWYAPPAALVEANREAGAHLALPRLGQSFELDGPLPDAPWWEER